MAYDQIQNCLQMIHFYFSAINSFVTSATELNNDLHKINSWDFQLKMSVKPDPIKQAQKVIFCRKTKKIYHPSLRFNNNIVSQTPYQKHLDIFLDA